MLDVNRCRTLDIDGDNPGCPESVFFTGDCGYCIEVSKCELIEVLGHELGLIPVWRVASALANGGHKQAA